MTETETAPEEIKEEQQPESRGLRRRLRRIERQRDAAVILLLAFLTLFIATLVVANASAEDRTQKTATVIAESIEDPAVAEQERKDEERRFEKAKAVAARNAEISAVECVTNILMATHEKTGLSQMVEVGTDFAYAKRSGSKEDQQHAQQEHDILMASIETCRG